jgi:hypothetical protein
MKTKHQKHLEAKERQESYDKLSTEQKLDRISVKPGESKKEKKRLLGRGLK